MYTMRCQGNPLMEFQYNNNNNNISARRNKQKAKKCKKFTNATQLPAMSTNKTSTKKATTKPATATAAAKTTATPTSTTTASYFSICISGQIVSATFPLGPDADFIFCRYELVAGPDWQLASGPRHGLTQLATNKNGNFNDKIVFNMPIEVTYKSTCPFGWPQILVSVFGRSSYGKESLLGYAHIHLPVFGGNQSAHLLNAPILMPKCPNMIADVTSWLLRQDPELKDPKVLLDNLKCKGLSMESYGTLDFQLHTIMRGARRLGYNWHA